MKNFKYIILLLTAICFMTSCNDFLSEIPDSRIELDKIDKLSELLTNAYPESSYLFLETMTDNVEAAPSNLPTQNSEELFCWKDVSAIGQDTPSFYWAYTYRAIAHANQVLESLPGIDGTEERKNAIKGEALLCRAYGHFMLVNIFAKHYNEETSSTDLGVPYSTKPEKSLITSYKRESVALNYQHIEADMLEGLSLINGKFYKGTGKYHFTREAALAFASRYYLYKKDYTSCVNYSSQLLGTTYNPTFIKDYQKVLSGQGVKGRAQVFSSTSEASNLLIMRKSLGYQLKFFAGYRLTNKIVAKVFEKDVRTFNMWAVGTDQLVAYQAKFEDLLEKTSMSSSSGMPYTVQPVLRGEEVLFNMMEALWEIAALEKDLTKQAEMDKKIYALLNPFIVERYHGKIGSDYISGTISSYRNSYFKKDTPDRVVFKRIMFDERRREFMEEGLRWFDIRRLGLEVVHVNLAGVRDVLKADDPRKVLQIPNSATSNGIRKNEIEILPPVVSQLLRF